jgi:hypothetical protein
MDWISHTSPHKHLLVEHLQFNLDTALEFVLKVSQKEVYHTLLKDEIEKLSRQDPGNAGWQRDIYVSYYKIASTLQNMKQQNEANQYWKKCFDVLGQMKTRGMYLDRQMENLYRHLNAYFNLNKEHCMLKPNVNRDNYSAIKFILIPVVRLILCVD